MWEEKFGRPCPRVELYAENEMAALFAIRFAARAETGDGALGPAQDAIVSGLVTAHAMRAGTMAAAEETDRALRALGDDEVVAALNERIERRRRAMEAKLGEGKAGRRR